MTDTEISKPSVERNAVERALLLAGFGIYLISFFAPAVAPSGTTAVPGWYGALFSLIGALNVVAKWQINFDALLGLASGLINPLLLIFAWLMFSNRPAIRRLKFSLAAIIVLFLAATWLLFAKEHIGVEIGHVLWVAGILLVVGTEIARMIITPEAE